MKCLIRMFNEEGKGVVFYETFLNFKWQKHTYIECVPVPYDLFEQLPGYFKVRLLRQVISHMLIQEYFRNLSSCQKWNGLNTKS